MSEENVKMSRKDYVLELVKLYREEESVGEQVKATKDAAKEAGHDPAIIATVAKAIVKSKTDDLEAKMEDTLEVLQEFHS